MNVHDATEQAYKNGYANGYNADRWIPVEQRLPVDNKQVLVYGMRGGIQVCRFESRFNERLKDVKRAFYRNDNKKEMTAKYWMPLPEPPKKAQPRFGTDAPRT